MTDWVPWLGPDNDAPLSGWYISSSDMGRWACYEGVELGPTPEYPSAAAYLEAVAGAFEYGTGP